MRITEGLVAGVTTAPRPSGVNYLGQTMESFARAGVRRLEVFAEPGSEFDARAGAWRENPRRLGNWHNWRNMAFSLLKSSHDWILTAEDDVELRADAFDVVNEFLDSREGRKLAEHSLSKTPHAVLSLYTAYPFSGEFQVWDRFFLRFQHHHREAAGCMAENFPGSHIVDHRYPDGWRRAKTGNWLGACALLWPARILEDVVKHPIAVDWQGLRQGNQPTPPADVAAVDSAIGLILNDLQIPMYVHVPSLSEHLGEVSSLGNKPWTLERCTGTARNCPETSPKLPSNAPKVPQC